MGKRETIDLILDTPPREDVDPAETQEWTDALQAVVQQYGPQRGRFLIGQLLTRAASLGVHVSPPSTTPYANTIPVSAQPVYGGDLSIEARLSALVRWNALAMVIRANAANAELGGHIASYSSAADLFEVGFNHFFRASDGDQPGDLVYFQAHSAPGIYARAFLEGGLSEDQLTRFRRETAGGGLCSYPHPWLMPGFWQFPTGSMGLGPISAIYQARFLRYLENRGFLPASRRRVWGVFGDGEMDEPESVAALTLAAREKLDNVTFVINCNLQRLDGPVRGNGQIVQELESLYRGAGWNVIKVLWGSDWDALFMRDHHGALAKKFASTVDGEFQSLAVGDGAFNREHFFSGDPLLSAVVAPMSDTDIGALRRGGHDPVKIFAAYAAAAAHKGQPTVILAQTKKGYGMGQWGEGKMTAHQQKKLDEQALLAFRDRFALPLSDDAVRAVAFLKPDEDSPVMRYLHARRAELGGYLPRRKASAAALAVPALDTYARFALQANGKSMSTTMALVRMLGALLKDDTLGTRIVPIVADEARTFGMANLFRQVGIYAPYGQLYRPEDADSMLYYREDTTGQILEEGITEAGALSSWIAAGTSYSTHGQPMLPLFIYYSMFGFQRVGDLIWAAADQRARGFLIGATSGRTTLSGEGLQHQDGSSHVMAATVPNCRAYDPAFACEVAVIMADGMRRMMSENEDVFYYLTVMNENTAQPTLTPGSEDGILRGMYRYARRARENQACQINLLGSGTILGEVLAAADLLRDDWDIASDIWSVTSFSELARQAIDTERFNLHHPQHRPRASYVRECLPDASIPVVAATDYVRAYPQLIATHVPGNYYVLGTDGFGRSDTRAALRRFFEVDRYYVCLTALAALAGEGIISSDLVASALLRYGIDAEKMNPWQA